MIGETYELHTSRNSHLFLFISEGRKGQILKVVIYSKTRSGMYN